MNKIINLFEEKSIFGFIAFAAVLTWQNINKIKLCVLNDQFGSMQKSILRELRKLDLQGNSNNNKY